MNYQNRNIEIFFYYFKNINGKEIQKGILICKSVNGLVIFAGCPSQ